MTRLLQRFLNHLLFGAVRYFAASAVADVGTQNGASAGTGAPAPTTGQQPPSGDSGQQPTGQGQQPNPQDRNWAEVRRNLDDLKAKYEPWEKLNLKPEEVGRYQGTYQKVYNAAAEIGRNLGFPDDQIAEALEADPIRTLDYLRGLAQQGQQAQEGDPDLEQLVAQHVEQAIGPIQERENVRMTNEANSLFERTVYQSAVESFKAEGLDISQIPQDELTMLMTATSEILKYDPEALRALKYEGKTAPIQKAFQQARTELDKYYLSRSGRDRARIVPPKGTIPTQNGTPRKPTLDEMIENPSVIDEAAGRDPRTGRYR